MSETPIGQPAGYISQSLPVPEGFEDLFTHFYYAANHSHEPVEKQLVPIFRTILVFSLGQTISAVGNGINPFELPDSLIIGPVKKTMSYTLFPGAEMLVVNFKWDAFYRFFGQSLQSCNSFLKNPWELTGDDCFADLSDRLKQIDGIENKIRHLIEFSIPYLKEREITSARIMGINERAETFVPVKKVAENSGYTERSVQLHYKKYLGFSDKEVNRYRRFKKAVDLLTEIPQNSPKPVDWFEIMEICGYYDQSHLIHDFTHYLHISPTQFLKLQENICVSSL